MNGVAGLVLHWDRWIVVVLRAMYAVWGSRGRDSGHGDDDGGDGWENGNGPALQKKRLHQLQAS